MKSAELSVSLCENTIRRPPMNQKVDSHQTLNLLTPWSWNSQPTELWKKCLLFKKPSLYYFCLLQPKLIKTLVFHIFFCHSPVRILSLCCKELAVEQTPIHSHLEYPSAFTWPSLLFRILFITQSLSILCPTILWKLPFWYSWKKICLY